ncbi:MAG: hypothetical protein AB1861_15780 [Cyanobacteriota bacterium]
MKSLSLDAIAKLDCIFTYIKAMLFLLPLLAAFLAIAQCFWLHHL